MKRTQKANSKNKNNKSNLMKQVEKDGIPTLSEWFKRTKHLRREPQLIQNLLSDQPGGYGIIAGRTGIGKTNLSIFLGYCLATGKPFYNLSCQKVGVAYLAAEGDQQNIRARLMKIGKGFDEDIDNFHFDFVPVQNPEIMLSDAVSRLHNTPDVKIIILDSAKYFVRGDYLKPSDVKEFIQLFEETLIELKMSGIVTLPISKPQDRKGLIRSSDIYSIKGATEWVDSATFGILLEKTAYTKKENNEVTMSFAKHRVALQEMNDIELNFDMNSCLFKSNFEVQEGQISVDLDHIKEQKHRKQENGEMKETRKTQKLRNQGKEN